MMDRLESGASPSEAGQREGTWLSRSVAFIGRAIIAGLVVVLARNPLLGHVPAPAATAVIAGGILAAGTALWLNRKRRSREAALLLACALPLLATGLALATGRGFRDPAILLMPASLLLCGVLLGRGALVATTALTIAAAAGIVLAETQGLLVPRPEADGGLGDILDSMVILGVTGFAVGSVGGRMRRGVERLRRQEAALRASEQRYRGLVELAADAILAGSPADGISEANRRASELTGYSREELLGSPIESLFSPEEFQRAPLAHDRVARGETVVFERLLTRKDGSTVPVEMSSKQLPDGTLHSILRDVSERHRAEAERRSLEERLRQAQKMEAVGRLAGGIAHDFNNLLTAITGSLTLALRGLPDDSPSRRWLGEVDKSAWRAAALTRHLLAFSRRQVIEPRVLDLRTVVEGAVSLVARTIGEDVKLDVRIAAEPCRVHVDQGQMEQVILNLATNARDAMPDGGRLSVELGRSLSLPAGAPDRLAAARGALVVLAVSDTGHGMRDDVRARIFEPFFTTKPSGTGTGLGLSMVYGAVEQNGGWIDVESAPGQGAAFRIYLPEAGTAPAKDDPSGIEQAEHGTETVLLVEDEAAVREVTAEQLVSLGYRVIACASGADALAAAARHEGPLDLLLTDVVMPDMNGRELATRLVGTRRDLRVLFTTGYGDSVVSRRGIVEAGLILLEKPFSLPALARQVRRALAA